MRSEHELALEVINRLEELKAEVNDEIKPEPEAQLWVEARRLLFSTLNERILQVNTTDLDKVKELTDLINEGLISTLSFMEKLISYRTTQDKMLTEADIESFLNSLYCAEQFLKKRTVKQIFDFSLEDNFETIAVLKLRYRFNVLNNDHTQIVLHSDDWGKVTVFQLQEMQYFLEMMLKTEEELSASHPIRTLPYARHMQISDEILDTPQLLKQQSANRLIACIETAQADLRYISSASYCAETSEKLKKIVAQQTEYFETIKKNVDILVSLSQTIQTPGIDDQEFQILINLSQASIDSYLALGTAAVLKKVSHAQAIASSGNSPCDILNILINRINEHKTRITGESQYHHQCDYFGLKSYRDELQRDKAQLAISDLEQNTKRREEFDALCQKRTGAISAIVARQQDRPQTQAAPILQLLLQPHSLAH